MLSGPWESVLEMEEWMVGLVAKSENAGEGRVWYWSILGGPGLGGGDGVGSGDGDGDVDVVGQISLMRFSARDRSVEIGGVMFSRALQRTRAATEVVFLLAREAFEVVSCSEGFILFSVLGL